MHLQKQFADGGLLRCNRAPQKYFACMAGAPWRTQGPRTRSVREMDPLPVQEAINGPFLTPSGDGSGPANDFNSL